MAHPFSDYTDWSNWQYKIAICRVYIYLVLKKLVIRLSVDLTYVFHNTKQIWRAQVDFLPRRKLSDQNDLLENLHTCGVNLHLLQSFTCLYFAISYTPSDPQDLPLPHKTILLIIIGLPDFKWLLKALLDGSSNYPSASLKTLSLTLSILVKISPLICDLKLPLMFALFLWISPNLWWSTLKRTLLRPRNTSFTINCWNWSIFYLSKNIPCNFHNSIKVYFSVNFSANILPFILK